MAVPKQKQSHARTAKRRAQHKAAVPTVNSCQKCGSPVIPHRVCGECGTYKGKNVTALSASPLDI